MLPYDVREKVLFPKDLIQHHPQMVLFIVIYGDKDHTIIGKQLP